MSAATKAELEAENKRLQRSLDRAATKVVALDKSLVRAKSKITALSKSVAEGREREKATAEILRVISHSSTDVQPVFDGIANAALRLIGGVSAAVTRIAGDMLHLAASTSTNKSGDAMLTSAYPRLLTDATGGHGRAIRSRIPYCVTDTEKLPDTLGRSREVARARGFRSAIYVPLLRDNVAIGSIGVTRGEPGAFSDEHIELLEAFGAQAVIAIENVRLFKELQARNGEITEALEQQTATAEILRVISSSPTDTQPVFDAVAESAARLCGAHDVVIRLVEGNEHRPVAHHGPIPVMPPYVVARANPGGRAIVEARTIHIADLTAEHVREEYPGRWSGAAGHRTFLCVPLVREDRAIGIIVLRRLEVRPFTDKQIKLLETFAAQAVIAIENVRLFKELQARNAEVTEALEQQTATAEILKVISSSPTNLQPVFDAILENATRLCDAHMANLSLYDGDKRILVAQRGASDEYVDWVANRGATQFLVSSPAARAIAERRPIQIADLRDISGYRDRTASYLVALVELGGARTALVVPMLKEGRVVGGITIYRPEVRPFTQKQIDLVSMFANQAVIAIENVRLFNEIQEKSRQLESASQHKSEFLANMSHELRTPLNAVIGFSEVLQQGMVGGLNDKQGEYIQYIHTSGSHLLSLINDILDLSKVEAGRMELDLTSFNVPMAIDNALTLVRERATRHGLTLDCTLDPAVADIHADERKFKQVMLNLLSNAVKFTPEGGQITVAARAVDDSVEVSVTDTGIGIAPEDCDAVFEEFRQVGHSSERKAEGTGLGLALTRKFIELHGGRIWLTSTPGKGSTFFFTLPVTQSTPATDQLAATH